VPERFYVIPHCHTDKNSGGSTIMVGPSIGID
jgi:molecular chaperone DnaK (HSP70)